MDIQEKILQLEEKINKLQYHISMLNTSEIYENNPIGYLVISLNWSEDDLNKAHDIFEKYHVLLENHKRSSLLYSEIESDFEKTFGIGYQTVKSIVLAFFRNNQWIDVCVAFVKSQGEHPPIEFIEISSYIKENNL